MTIENDISRPSHRQSWQRSCLNVRALAPIHVKKGQRQAAREKAEKALRQHQPERIGEETLRRLNLIRKKSDEIV